MRKGFTIVELLMVIGIIAILTGIITTAASQSVKASRARRAEALCALVQSGLAAYYAQNDKWPIDLESKSSANHEGANRSSNDDIYVLNGTEVRTCVKTLVDEAKKGNPLMDISGLYVSRSNGELAGESVGEQGQNTARVKSAVGMDFMSAIHGTRESRKRMSTSEMYFGYPDPETGHFLRFKMSYSIPTDQLTVGKQR